MIREVTNPTLKPEFGTVPTDHMFNATYENDHWDAGELVPFGQVSLSPFAACFHYGQTVFEGLKAYRQPGGGMAVFRHRDNFGRLNKSLERMGMPALPYEVWERGLTELVKTDAHSIPGKDGILYIRPFVIATEARLGVRISGKYLFVITTCEAGDYYNKPLSVMVETRFSRAGRGGVGYAKCGGNYGASFYPFKLAKEKGYDQVIWTDAATHQFVEESGTMNLAFIAGGELLTPPASETILDGITRKSIIALAADLGLGVREVPIGISDMLQRMASGERIEAFGVGTAAVIAPIEHITWNDHTYSCYVGEDASMYKLKKALLDIKFGRVPDKYGWMTVAG